MVEGDVLHSLHFASNGAEDTMPALPKTHWLYKALRKYEKGDAFALASIKIEQQSFSPFFKKVYQCARGIPFGATVSYGELAKIAGNPKAARAVGMAMRSNRTVLVVPCHRVIGANRKLVGFNSPQGTKMKASLLRHEGCHSGWVQ